MRIDAAHEQRLGSEHVADPGDHRLVHHRRGDAGAAPLQRRPHPLGIGVAAQRVRAQPCPQTRFPVVVEQLAGGGSSQADGHVLGAQLQACPGGRRRGRPAIGCGMPAERAVQAEVDVQHVPA